MSPLIDVGSFLTASAIAVLLSTVTDWSSNPVMAPFVTVTTQLAVTLGFAVDFAVMVAEPNLFPVTLPVALSKIIAALLFSQDHVTAGLAPLFTVATGVNESLTAMVFAAPTSKVMLLTAAYTVTAQVAATLLPSFAFAVMVAVPAETAATTPAGVTVATLLSLLLQVTEVSVASEGVTAAVKVTLPVNSKSAVVVLSVICVTGPPAANTAGTIVQIIATTSSAQRNLLRVFFISSYTSFI